jgi:hypothetical protein
MNKVKVANKENLKKGIPGITFSTKNAALQAVSGVKDNGINVYTDLQRKEEKTLGAGVGTVNPEIYQGEVVLYSLKAGNTFMIFSGVILEILEVKVSRGTTRGEQLAKLGVTSQWLIVCRRLGVPHVFDIVDEYGVVSQLRFVMDAMNGEIHEVQGLEVAFEDLVSALSNGCIHADIIISQIIRQAVEYHDESNNLQEIWDSIKDKDKPTLH